MTRKSKTTADDGNNRPVHNSDADKFTPEEQKIIDEYENPKETPTEPETPETTDSDKNATVTDQPQEKPEKKTEPTSTEPEKQPTVPHQKFHAERIKRKQLENELNQLRQTQLQTQPQPQNDTPPTPAPQYIDPVEDPAKYEQWAKYNAQQPMLQIQKMQQQQAVQNALNQLNQFEKTEAEKQPHYYDAVAWAKEQRTATLTEAGLTTNEISQQLANDVINLYQAGIASGISPARLFYLQAVEAGFTPPTPPPTTPETTTPSPETQKAVDRINTLNKAQKNTQSLTQTGEPLTTNKISPTQAAQLSEKDFSKLSDDELKRLLAGG